MSNVQDYLLIIVCFQSACIALKLPYFMFLTIYNSLLKCLILKKDILTGSDEIDK